jgi:hypothetical protein
LQLLVKLHLLDLKVHFFEKGKSISVAEKFEELSFV